MTRILDGSSMANALMIAIIMFMPAGSFAQQSRVDAKTTPPAPKAVVPVTSFSFDDVYKGEIISQIFIIKNVGDADLHITDFTAGCSCEVVEADRVIPPGKEGKAQIEINTSNVVGGAIRTATLHTDDPDRPSIVLSLLANVLSNPDGSPIAGATLREGKHIGPLFVGPGLRWGARIAPGAKSGTEFTISADRGQVKIVGVEGDQTHFATRVTTIEEGKKYKLAVETVPADTPGRYESTLRVTTDSSMLPYFEIKLFLIVRPKT